MTTFLQRCFRIICTIFLFLAAILWVQYSVAQVKFSVVCPNKKIGKDDQLQIQFKVEGASSVDNITPPDLKDFNIVSGPNQQRSMTSINGKVSQSVAIGFSLQPISTGKFTIGPATAVADGNKYQTSPVTITVVPGSISPQNNTTQNASPFPNLNFDLPSPEPRHQFDDYILKPGEDATEKIKKDIFIKLDVSKKNCYVGEPVVASFKLYTRLPSETIVTSAPSFNGFSVSDMDVNNNNASQEKFDGRLYNVYTLRKVQLYPLQSGTFSLDPIVSDNKITFIKSGYARSRGSSLFDMFDDFDQAPLSPDAQIQKDATIKSDPVNITVKPLPAENKPADFRGAVGNFTVSASLAKNQISTDDAGSLTVTVSGSGNISLINAPSIVWPKGIDGFDPQLKENIDKSQVPMKGSKTFTYPFTISQPGDYVIDSIAFSYFDPSTATYKTLHTNPLLIQVKKGKGIATSPLVKNASQNDSDGLFDPKTERVAGIVFIAGTLVLIFYLLIRRNRNKDDLEKQIKLDDLKNEVEPPKKEFLIPENPLNEPYEKMTSENTSAFYHSLDTSMRKYLAGKFQVPANELSRKRITEELDKCNVSLNTSLMLSSLLDEIEMNIYAPLPGASQMNAVFEKASEVVSLLDKQVC